MKTAILAMVCFAAVSFSAFAATPEEVKRTTPAYDGVANMVDAIVAQHPGKTVFVDFWATWCGPCVNAMKTIEPLKPWMEENDIVKVYISAPTSDAAKWEAMIGEIGGNHYWATKEEWAAICERYGIKGIPHYQVYNKKGEVSFQKTGYPGNDTMKAEFEKAL
jgi:thiol-disulfide isomerase/thioredoxin